MASALKTAALRGVVRARFPRIGGVSACSAHISMGRVIPATSQRLLCSSTAQAAPAHRSVVDELHRLEHESPWYQYAFLRLGGTFSDTQKQAAAGADMYMHCISRAQMEDFFDPSKGRLDDRFLVRFQLVGLHCWMCHARLRREPKDRYDTLFREMMEKVWYSTELDLHNQYDFGFIQLTKHIKEMQFNWHGTARSLDSALDSALPPEESQEQLKNVLMRNFYADAEGEALDDERATAGGEWLSEYVVAQLSHLRDIDSDDRLRGRVSWPAAVEAAGGNGASS